MAIQLTCEGCGQRVKVQDHAAGRKGKCPACGREILIPGEKPVERAAAEPVTSGPVARAESGAQASPAHAPSARREANALGIASLVLGILALLVAWIPLLGLLAWPLGGIGLLLGLIGLVLAARNGRWGTTSAIVGLATNGAAVFVALAVSLWAGYALQQAALTDQLGAVSDVPKGSDLVLPLPAPEPTPQPKASPPEGTFAGQDRNGDNRLNADEVPDALKARFAEVDTNGDGYVDKAEWDRAASPASDSPPARGRVMAQRIFTAADDFVVDVWHNGQRVPDDRRQMVGENYGASSEKIEVEVREGDWLVFNVANNRLRWDGASYFGAAGVNDGDPQVVGFTTDPADGRWSYCDDPARVPAFIARPRYLADQAAQSPANPWGGGDGEMKSRVPGWNGHPIWGKERTTWLKFVARPAPAGAPGSATKSASAATKPQAPPPERETPAGGTPETVAAGAAAPALTLTKRATFTGHPALVYCVAVSTGGRKLVSSSAMHVDSDSGKPDARTLIVWDIADRGKTRMVIPIQQSLLSFALTADGKSIIAPVDNGLSVFDMKNGRRTKILPGPPQTSAMSAAVSPDGKVAAAGFLSKEILLWNLKTGKPMRTLRGHAESVIRLAFSPDSKQLASGSSDKSVRLWDVATGRAERTIQPEGVSSPVTCVVYSPDGSRLASVHSGDPPRFWDPASGQQLQTLGDKEVLSYQSVSISPDGRRLATASLDPLKMKRAVVLWDAATGRRLATAEDGDGQVNAVAFTPDGNALASGGGNIVKLWDIAPAP